MSKKKTPYTALRAAGIATIVGVSALTGFTVKMAVDDANNRADASYKSALSGLHSSSTANEDDAVTTGAITTPTEAVVETTAADVEITTEVTTEAIDNEPDIITTEPNITDEDTEQPPDDQNMNRVDETPEDLGYDLTNITITDDGSVAYIVQHGDSLSVIGSRFGYSVPELAAANPYITNLNLIYSGNPVVLPCDEDFLAYVQFYKEG